MFLPGTGKTCALANLPDQRVGHTLDTVDTAPVLCAGVRTENSCLQFSQTTGGIIIGPSRVRALPFGVVGRTKWPLLIVVFFLSLSDPVTFLPGGVVVEILGV